MAKLIQCKDCGHNISKNAVSCPNCGAKNKRTSVITWLALILIGLPFLFAIFRGASDNNDVSESVEVEELSPSETLDVFELEQNNFDKHAWTAVSYAQATIKQGMKDPDSAEFGYSSYVKASKNLPATVCGEVNGKNSFNGYSGFKRYFLVPTQTFYSIDDGTPEFNEAYNGFCTLK